jgi:hypothetical protein
VRIDLASESIFQKWALRARKDVQGTYSFEMKVTDGAETMVQFCSRSHLFLHVNQRIGIIFESLKPFLLQDICATVLNYLIYS